jgi:transposase
MNLEQASREDLLELVLQHQRTIAQYEQTIAQLQAVIAKLEARVAELEARLGPSGGKGMPGLKPKAQEPAPKKPRKPRTEGFGRERSTPTMIVTHAVDRCPGCDIALVGGSVKRTREVIELAPAPVQIVEHQYVERRCPLCGKRWVPKAELADAVVGQGRFGIELLCRIAAFREEGRLPVRTIQWLLATVHELPVSVGAIVAACHTIARVGRAALEEIRAQVRASPVVNADETGWREAGRNGYAWTFSTPTERYFTHGNRAKEMVDEALGDEFRGVLVSDFYGAYHHYDGWKQRCWAHLLRDIHDLRVLYPAEAGVQEWATELHKLFVEARTFTAPERAARRAARWRFEQRALELCAPYAEEAGAAPRRLSARVVRHLKELFVFVGDPEVPATNNAAERSLRHLVVSRKISGGTRSALGTQTKMALASLFGTWRARGLNPLTACRQLLLSPQV